MRRRILLHSRPVYSIPLREMIAMSQAAEQPIDWSVLAYSDADGSLAGYAALLGRDRVHCLQRELPAALPTYHDVTDLGDMAEFPASVHAAVATSKLEWGLRSLWSRPRTYQLALVRATHAVYKRVLLAEKPDFVMIPIVEQYDALILVHLCQAMGIRLMIYAHARTLDRAFFTESLVEVLPRRAFDAAPAEAAMHQARDFVTRFRDEHRASFVVDRPDPATEIPVPGLRRRLPSRAVHFGARAVRRLVRPDGPGHEPHLVDTYSPAKTLTIHYIRYLKMFRRLKGRSSKHLFDVRTEAQLPKDFVYFPLQVTPEASIDVQCPYFADQVRAIDLLLLNLPAHWRLVVKEHPAMRGIRSPKLYADLKTRASLLLADYDLPGRALIERARVTVSVTGTSCLEALLLGRPALQLGRSFFSPWIATFDSFEGFKDTLLATASKAPTFDDAVDLVARVLTIGRRFLLYPPTDPYHGPAAVMNRDNLRRLVDAVAEHVVEESACAG
jgi:Capsule polysaccharide biosynthesis protein